MKVNSFAEDRRGLTRRQLLGLATLTSAGLAAASVGVPEAKAAPKPGEQYEPLEDFKHDLEESEGWVGEGGSAKESTIKQLPVATSIASVSMRLKGFGHFVEQIGDEPTKVLILFNSPVYEEINISTWLAANPVGIITDNFGISRELAAKLPKKSIVIAAPQSGLSSST